MNKILVLEPEAGFSVIGRLTAVHFLRQVLEKQHTITSTKKIDEIIYTTECELISINEMEGVVTFRNLKTTKQRTGEKNYLSCDIVPHEFSDSCDSFNKIVLHLGEHGSENNHYDDDE